MANAYRAKRDVSFPRVLGTTGSHETNDLVEATEGVNYAAGSTIDHATLPRFVRERIEAGELDHLVEPIENDDEADQALEGVQDEEYGVFVPEHEAEAHALLAAGKGVVPKDQVLDSLSAGEEYSDQYQAAVKEHGLDHRPAQEFLAQAAQERVPDEVLYGAQTGAGVPHNRGPEGTDEPNSEEPVQAPGGDEPQTVRPRPQVGQDSPDEGTEGQD